MNFDLYILVFKSLQEKKNENYLQIKICCWGSVWAGSHELTC